MIFLIFLKKKKKKKKYLRGKDDLFILVAELDNRDDIDILAVLLPDFRAFRQLIIAAALTKSIILNQMAFALTVKIQSFIFLIISGTLKVI